MISIKSFFEILFVLAFVVLGFLGWAVAQQIITVVSQIERMVPK